MYELANKNKNILAQLNFKQKSQRIMRPHSISKYYSYFNQFNSHINKLNKMLLYRFKMSPITKKNLKIQIKNKKLELINKYHEAGDAILANGYYCDKISESINNLIKDLNLQKNIFYK